MSLQAAEYRADTFCKIRDYFRERGVLEVETPLMSRGSATDACIDVFSTLYKAGSPDSQRLYLQTSPELYMKRMLCRGYPSIFQICRVFRDHEHGRLHNPEFTMLEWYRLDYNYRRLMRETAELCRLVLGPCPVLEKSYRDVFTGITGLDPYVSSEQDLTGFIKERAGEEPPFSQKADLLNYITASFIEPALPPETLSLIFNYPMELANLARQDPEEPLAANRFEAFYNGVELCNGFEEITGAEEYKERFLAENVKRRKAGKRELPLDEKFLKDIRKGLPPCSGAALGLDRLVMLGMGDSDIASVLEFPIDDC
ncbi:EF-P lysine aminoacylase EpmA [Fibrobacterota bacterium]